MTEDNGESRRWIRARQRDHNSSMVGFDAALAPRIADVGVDMCQVTISGRWRSQSANGWSLFENALHLPHVDWFNRPARSLNPNSTSCTVRLSKRRNGSTITACNIAARRLNTSDGIVQIDLTLNPTRTLAHLLAREPELNALEDTSEGRFLDVLHSLELTDFFARADESQIARALDGSDNVLPPTRQVRERLGSNFWPAFLALFVERIRQLCVTLLSEYPDVQTDGTTDQIMLPNGSVTLDWAEVKVPQIECYFERFHREAVGAVRRGGWALLAADHSGEMRSYADRATFTRDNDRFAIGLPLNDVYKLAVYAKLRDRIRFEVRRTGKGNYSGLPPASTPARLLDIMEHQREHVLGAVIWPSVGELLAGPDRPQLHDLAYIIGQVRNAVDGDAEALAAVLSSLLIEGSVSEVTATSRVIQRLMDGGLIERPRIRRRDINNRVTRYVLTAPYRDVHASLADPLL